MLSLLSISTRKAALIALCSPFLLAHAQLPGSGVQEALRCPAAYQCADAVVFQYDPVYELEPTYVTSDQIHTSKTTHTLTSKTFVAKVTTVVAGYQGLCEQWVPTTIKTRPTLTVWRDVTTTAHYYSSVIETEELTHTHTVTQTSACMREIDRRPLAIETPALLKSRLPQTPLKPEGSPVDDLLGGIEDKVTEVGEAALKEAGKQALKAGVTALAPELPGLDAAATAVGVVQGALNKEDKNAKAPAGGKKKK